MTPSDRNLHASLVLMIVAQAVAAFSSSHARAAQIQAARHPAAPPAAAQCARSWPAGPPAVHRALGCLGLAVGNDPKEFARAVGWSRGAVNAVTVFTGQASWPDFDGGIGYEIDLWRHQPETKLWSIPLIVKGANLHSASVGEYNNHYHATAQALASAYPEGIIYVRTGWEFNGGWMPWSAIKDPADYRLAYRHFVASFRKVSDRFVFTWAPNIGNVGMDPALGYPGDDVVDIIGMDFYWQWQWDPRDATRAWDHAVNRTYGLQWLETFAAAHHKPTAYPEWGVRGDDSAPFILGFANWITRHNVAYQSYWDDNDDYPGKLSDGKLPHASQAFLSRFGAPNAPDR